ncbi:hypothetical protein BD309DRAFT_867422 [Dichomitus squalens]|uniref:Uncharacterized protein n=2 Tax=Dichomitus squalens TaxID=114155 RepID=A0A4Q9MNJ3_9APHY|nr:uncharacterized protein DICSQDRAFT_173391 [Dichomitus squalens LYAD-421 SS1]EJF58022.1 hypothetical protein DICSQDRAFT_173391 [Dichomitus squalens LYAD-421 SS1]TBU29280.1 hypothetical protein BD311DRAFT_276239 [Dichomitus squalens]TBU41898.1 hypothetical protein BD309DRAFT_867422 [Dichomitus squalens]TBU53928.1 hypothetical protein BD310DRAFT_980734 [Dichomitus squalens]
MRHYSFLRVLFLASIAAAGALAVAAQTAEPSPEFQSIFVGQLVNEPYTNTTGPFGFRVHAPVSGGNLTDATTNEVVATLLPTTDTGIITEEVLLFPLWVLPYIWKEDGRLASMTVKGVGNTTTDTYCYVHVETDSPTYSWMNRNFFIMKIVATADPLLHVFTMYGISNL